MKRTVATKKLLNALHETQIRLNNAIERGRVQTQCVGDCGTGKSRSFSYEESLFLSVFFSLKFMKPPIASEVAYAAVDYARNCFDRNAPTVFEYHHFDTASTVVNIEFHINSIDSLFKD